MPLGRLPPNDGPIGAFPFEAFPEPDAIGAPDGLGRIGELAPFRASFPDPRVEPGGGEEFPPGPGNPEDVWGVGDDGKTEAVGTAGNGLGGAIAGFESAGTGAEPWTDRLVTAAWGHWLISQIPPPMSAIGVTTRAG
jgi:hypothetical protein